MKKLFALAMAAALTLAAMAGCSSKPAAQEDKDPEKLTVLYAGAIAAHGGEMVEYNPVISEHSEENDLLLESLGLAAEDMTAFGVSVSMMNVKAYGIAAVMPAEGKEEAVKAALQNFIDQKQLEFERYLPDQYQVAKNARLETLTDGTVLMVMCEEVDSVYDSISTAIEAG